MSRIGKLPVAISSGVDVKIDDGFVVVKGKKGELSVAIIDGVTVDVQADQVVVNPVDQSKRSRSRWGTIRALINNAVLGVTDGFVRRLEVRGVGYRANVQGKVLNLQLGYSHDIKYPIPEDLEIKIEGDRNEIIAVYGISKQRVGQIASEIRSYRTPEPYKGKGVRYVDEVVYRKEGKKKK